MSNDQKGNIYALDLHEATHVNIGGQGVRVIRVPGGWIYDFAQLHNHGQQMVHTGSYGWSVAFPAQGSLNRIFVPFSTE